MLGSLARKLRAFGFDTAYYREGDDNGIISLACSEGRVVLTSDRSLAAKARTKGAATLLIAGRTDGRRISSLLDSAKAAGIHLVRGEPLCSLCGGELVILGRKEAASGVPASAVLRHRLFFRCSKCGQFYWRGSHWKKLRRLERAFGSKV